MLNFVYNFYKNYERVSMNKEIENIILKNNLNKQLLVKRNISDENIILMGYYYNKLNNLLKQAEELEKVKKYMSNKQYRKEAKKIGKEVDKVEKELQKLWKFEPDENFYTYWFKIPGCVCPKLDNEDFRGRGRIIVENCPYHTFLMKKE